MTRYAGICGNDQRTMEGDSPWLKCVCGRLMDAHEIEDVDVDAVEPMPAGDVTETYNVPCPREDCGRVHVIVTTNGKPHEPTIRCSCFSRRVVRTPVKVPIRKVIQGVELVGLEEQEKAMVSSYPTMHMAVDLLALDTARCVQSAPRGYV